MQVTSHPWLRVSSIRFRLPDKAATELLKALVVTVTTINTPLLFQSYHLILSVSFLMWSHRQHWPWTQHLWKERHYPLDANKQHFLMHSALYWKCYTSLRERMKKVSFLIQNSSCVLCKWQGANTKALSSIQPHTWVFSSIIYKLYISHKLHCVKCSWQVLYSSPRCWSHCGPFEKKQNRTETSLLFLHKCVVSFQILAPTLPTIQLSYWDHWRQFIRSYAASYWSTKCQIMQ